MMNQDEWVENRLLWKARKHNLPTEHILYFSDVRHNLRDKINQVTSNRSVGFPVIVLFRDNECWTLLGTRKMISFHSNDVHECDLRSLLAVRPGTDPPPGGSLMEIGSWKGSWDFLRVCDGNKMALKIWVPRGFESYILENMLLLFPAIYQSDCINE